MIPAAVIIDTQNFYGFSGAVLGPRAKADPQGIVDAFGALGFTVDEICIPIAIPEDREASDAADRLRKARQDFDGLLGSLAVLSRGLHPIPGASHHLATASSSLGRIVSSLQGVGTAAQMQHGRQIFGTLQGQSRDALTAFRQTKAAIENVLEVAALVPPSDAVTGHTLASSVQLARWNDRLRDLGRRVDDLSSYLYAAGSNLDYLDRLDHISTSVAPDILKGRFPIGRGSGRAGEKQVDTICAVELLERVRAAIDSNSPRAVIVISDDDDLSPAIRRATSIALGSAVRVIVAGTATISNRWRRSAADRASWLQLDASTICTIAGRDPQAVFNQREELALLSLNQPVTFSTLRAGVVVSRGGLEAQYAGPPLPSSGSGSLYLARLTWGGDGSLGVPRLEVTATQRTAGAVGRLAHAQPRSGSIRATDRTIPIQSSQFRDAEAIIAAPGWWTAGTGVVVCAVTMFGRQVEKVLGPQPATSIRPASALRVTVRDITNGYATVRGDGKAWDVALRGAQVAVGDSVVVWPYEHSRTSGTRFRPNAVLLSSSV